MTARVALAVLLGLSLGLGSVAVAHTVPARRSIAVQANGDALVVLAMWNEPGGAVDGVLDGIAASSGQRDTNDALLTLFTSKAINPLSITVDGVRPADLRMSTKLTGTTRRQIAVLLEVPLAGREHEIVIALQPPGDATLLAFEDRTDGALTTSGNVPTGGLVPDGGTAFTLHWKKKDQE